MKMSETKLIHELIVSPLPEGRVRLDIYLSRVLEGVSRSKVQEMISSGLVEVNSVKVSAKHQLSGGERIQYGDLGRAQTTLEPVQMNLEILFEDDHLIFINKPAGVAVHPGAGETDATLVNGLLYHAKKLGMSQSQYDDEDPSYERPGIVHRLDKDTTGVMVVAKTDFAHAHLSKQFHDKTNFRQYVALLNGAFPEGEWVRDSYLFRDPKERTRFSSIDVSRYEHLKSREGTGEDLPGYRFARTLFKREAQYRGVLSLVSVKLSTGRTHQIRLHAKDLGAPIIGDPVYGAKAICAGRGVFTETIEERIVAVRRQMLHAWVLGLTHPATGKWMQFEAPLPDDFASLVKMLEAYKD